MPTIWINTTLFGTLTEPARSPTQRAGARASSCRLSAGGLVPGLDEASAKPSRHQARGTGTPTRGANLSNFLKPCLGCGTLTRERRCPDCHAKRLAEMPKPKGRDRHYRGDYDKRAKAVRDSTERCWICGEGARAGDPWQADHIIDGDPYSPLLGAHRSCNIRRSRQTPPR